jgi:hypothetical protein
VPLTVQTAPESRGHRRAAVNFRRPQAGRHPGLPGLQARASTRVSPIGLVIFAAFTMIDFQRLRKNADIRGAPLLAASIFLAILNVFLFVLTIFGGERE